MERGEGCGRTKEEAEGESGGFAERGEVAEGHGGSLFGRTTMVRGEGGVQLNRSRGVSLCEVRWLSRPQGALSG